MSSENIDDRLSKLPEEIVSRILSLMPTKFAVRTSILSKRWRYSWMFVTNLDFDDIHSPLGIDSFIKFVDGVLEVCKTSQLELFRLSVSSFCYQESSIASWIDKAVGLNVPELDLHVIPLKLPLSFFTCETLTKLRLDWWDSAQSDPVLPGLFNFPCLKTLDVVLLSIYSVSAFKLIHGCPVLESLFLKVSCCNDVDDYVFNIPTLKRLELTVIDGVPVFNKVVLNVPNLEYLFVSGTLCSSFVMEDVSALVEASQSFHEVANAHLWVELLKGVSGAKSLSLQYVSCFHDIGKPVFPSLLIFQNMTRLELKGCWDSGLLTKLLEGSPKLKHLCVETVYDFDIIFKLFDPNWVESKMVPACVLTNLTTIEFSKCEGTFFERAFLEYVIANAKALKMVKVTWEDISIEKEIQLCAKLLEAPRASSSCEIHFLGRCSFSPPASK